MDEVGTIFDRYEAVRHRLPASGPGAETTDISSLLDISDQIDAFVFDAFGVLNVGETPIPGAAERLEQLRERGHAIRILSNAASYDRAGAYDKFCALGLGVSLDEIVTSRMAALAGLGPGLWGCIAAPTDDLADAPAGFCRLEDVPEDYDRVDGFLFLSTAAWTPERQDLLERSLRAAPRHVTIANADLVAPRDHGFSLEPGFYGHRLADHGLGGVRFFGKPFPEVYDMVEAALPDVAPDRIAMCGDTLHTDILGAAARGWRTVLVTRDGLFRGSDTRAYCRKAGIYPEWSVERI